MTGCTNDDDTLDTRGTIRFRVSDEWIQGTRALANSATDLQAKPFCVLGKYSTGDTYAATNTVFDNQEVSYTDASGWDYNPKKNWEKSSTYRFCAYWPKTDGATLTGDMNSTIRIENFRVDPEYSRQGDLCISDVKEQVITDNPREMSETTNGNFVNEGIPFRFRHLLSNVRFAVAKTYGTQSTVVVTNVRLSNVKNTATFTMTSSNNGTDWNTGSWTQPTGSVVYNSGVVSQGVAVATYNSTTTEWEWDSDGLVWEGFVAIPQTVNPTGAADADKVSVTIEYSSTPDSGTATVRRVTAELPADQVWQMNKRITYKVRINEDNTIKFGKPMVESWGTAQASGTIIIK